MTRGSSPRTLLQLRLACVSLEYSGDASSAGAVIDTARASLAAALDGPSLLESRDAPSLEDSSDASSEDLSDASSTSMSDAVRVCGWCPRDLPATAPTTARWCSKVCRQAAWRQRLLSRMEGADGAPKRVAYADPPYPGTARKYYGDEPTYAGEVDHVALLERLRGFDGWALSTSAKALRVLLPLCPENARVCVWVKPHGVSSKTRGLHNAWEPIIVVPARTVRPGVPDYLSALPARRGGELPGRKPQKFCARLFQWLGMRPGDELDDLFPGTGIVTRAWRETARSATR